MEAISLTHIPNSSTPQWGRQNKRKKTRSNTQDTVCAQLQLKLSTAMQVPTLGSLMEADSRDTGHFHLAEGTLLQQTPQSTLLVLATDQQWELQCELLVTSAALP